MTLWLCLGLISLWVLCDRSYVIADSMMFVKQEQMRGEKLANAPVTLYPLLVQSCWVGSQRLSPNSALTLSFLHSHREILKDQMTHLLRIVQPPFLDSKASSLISLLLDAQQLTLSRCLCNGWTSLESKTFLDLPPPYLLASSCRELMQFSRPAVAIFASQWRSSSPRGLCSALCGNSAFISLSIAARATLA